MKVKSVMYAAVGAPVVAARSVSTKSKDVYGKLNEQASGYSKTAGKTIDGWAVEGEKVVVSVKDRKVVDEITAKVDLGQAKEQVSKLRDQLEDLLATWRSSFRPEKAEVKDTKGPAKEATVKEAAAKEAAAKEAAASAPADKKAATEKSDTKKSAAKKPATKASATKASAAKTTKEASAAKTSTEKTSSTDEADKAS